METFAQFYLDHRDKLFTYLLHKCGNIALASDLMQESFTKYLERYGATRTDPPLLFTIGRNLFYDQVRRPRDRQLNETTTESPVTDQENRYLLEEQAQNLQNALMQLTDEERDILSLAVNSDLCYREIGRIHRCSVANVKVKVHRARVKLKKILEEP